jgi:hypothetical protein
MERRPRTSLTIGAILLGFVGSGLVPFANATQAKENVAPQFETLAAQIPELYLDRRYLKLEHLLATLARLDPPRALKLVKTLEREAQFRASIVVLSAWLRQDADKALAWAKENNPGVLRRMEIAYACVATGDLQILDKVLLAAGAGGPPRSQTDRSMDRRSAEGEAAAMFARPLAAEWAKVDPAPVVEWARGLTSRGFSWDVQYHALLGVVRVLAEKSPAETFDWLQKGIFIDPQLDPARNVPRGLYQSFVEGVVQGSSPEAAAAYFHDKPNKPDYALAYGALARTFAKTAPERVAEWLDAIEDPRFRNSASTMPVFELRDTRPDMAAELMVKYGSDPNHERTLTRLRQIIVSWAIKDAKAALAFVENAPHLTPESRAALKSAINPTP